MLSNASGTTDQSQIQSTMLEELEDNIVKDKVSFELAFQNLIQFAREAFDLELSESQIQAKLKNIRDGVNLERVRKSLGAISMLGKKEEAI